MTNHSDFFDRLPQTLRSVYQSPVARGIRTGTMFWLPVDVPVTLQFMEIPVEEKDGAARLRGENIFFKHWRGRRAYACAQFPDAHEVVCPICMHNTQVGSDSEEFARLSQHCRVRVLDLTTVKKCPNPECGQVYYINTEGRLVNNRGEYVTTCSCGKSLLQLDSLPEEPLLQPRVLELPITFSKDPMMNIWRDYTDNIRPNFGTTVDFRDIVWTIVRTKSGRFNDYHVTYAINHPNRVDVTQYELPDLSMYRLTPDEVRQNWAGVSLRDIYAARRAAQQRAAQQPDAEDVATAAQALAGQLAQQASARQASAQQTATQQAPAQQVSAQQAPTQQMPVRQSPVKKITLDDVF